MGSGEETLRRLTHEFFLYYPDYAFCQTLAFNTQNGVTRHQDALELLSKKARAAQQNSSQIEEKLDRRAVMISGELRPVKDLSLQQIMNQERAVLKEIAEFYFKHPYAHGRTKKSRFLPRIVRTFFLSALIGHCKKRDVDLDYESYFDMLTVL